MIHELKQPIKKWMGVDKVHSGFYTFDFSTPSGRKFVKIPIVILNKII